MWFSRLATTVALLALVFSNRSDAQTQSKEQFFEIVASNDSAAVARAVKADAKLLKAKNEDEWTALHVAAYGGYDKSVSALLAAGAPLESRDPDGEHALHLAAANGKTAVAQALLDHKAQVDPKNDEGETPLFEASESGKVEIVKLLLAHGANAAVRNRDGLTPLMVASRSGYLPVVQLLADNHVTLRDVDTVAKSDFLGYSALHFAVEAGKTDVVQYLLLNGAHPVGRIANGNLPIHLAATWHSNDTIIDLLISYAAFVDARNRFLQTPMHLAVWEDRPAIVEKLLSKGAHPNLKDSAGSTPLLLAAHAGRAPLVNLLLTHNADPNIANSAGQTALMLAVKGGYSAVVSLLLEHEAKLPAKDTAGHTVLYYLQPETAPQMLSLIQNAVTTQLSPADREAAAKYFEDRSEPQIAAMIRRLGS